MRTLKVSFLILGIILLSLIIYKTGLDNIYTGIQALGVNLTWVIAMTSVSYLTYTAAWRKILACFGKLIPFWDLFRIRVSGEMASMMTPLNFAGGDPIRVYLLKKSFPVIEGAASVVIDRTIHILSIILMILTGIWAAFLKIPLEKNLRIGLVAALSLFTLFLLLLFTLQRRKGFFTALMRLGQALRIKKTYSEKALATIESMDSHIRSFYRGHKRLFIQTLLLHYIGRWTVTAEILMISHFMGVPLKLVAALFLTAVMPLINVLFAAIPGAFGVMEGTFAAIFYALNYNPAYGVTLQIARRMRGLFWILLGLFFILIHDRELKNLQEVKDATL